jgi:hypothetical protein
MLQEPSSLWAVRLDKWLLRCIYEIGEGSEHRGWLRLGHATRLAQLLPLHKLNFDQNQMDWSSSTLSNYTTDLETKQRTLWCCFCLDRLLANGRDRIATFSIEDITTRLPQHDEDFIYCREKATLRLNQSQTSQGQDTESLFASTIRIIDLLSQITVWLSRRGAKIRSQMSLVTRDAFHCP